MAATTGALMVRVAGLEVTSLPFEKHVAVNPYLPAAYPVVSRLKVSADGESGVVAREPFTYCPFNCVE